MLGNKEEELFAFHCPSHKSPTVSGEIQEIAAGADSEGRAAAAWSCKSGQGRADALAACGRRAGARALGTFQVFSF